MHLCNLSHNFPLILPGFLTGSLQTFSRQYNLPIDHLTFKFKVIPVYRDQEQVTEAMAKLEYGQRLSFDDEIEEVRSSTSFLNSNSNFNPFLHTLITQIHYYTGLCAA